MKSRLLSATTAAISAWSFCFHPCVAEEVSKVSPSPAASLQQQIDELKQGQARVLKELEEIKQLLQRSALRKEEALLQPAQPARVPISIQGEQFRGAAAARVAIMEYSDFDCSFCATYSREIFPKIEENYIKPGKVKYFFRDMPAREHATAMLKARAARCAGDQGKYWEMHDRLFAMQTAPDGADMAAHARSLGLNEQEFTACLQSGRHEESIRRNVGVAKRAGVFGTPAFLVGTLSPDGNSFTPSTVQVGGESFEALQSALEELLKAAATK